MAQTVLITGASSGIGRELAKQFARHGFNLVLAARSEQGLAEVAHEVRSPVETVPIDLAEPQAGSRLLDQLTARAIQIDVVVNNAGFGLQGEFAQLPLDRQLEMMQLNMTTLTELTRLLMPGMLSRRSGGVLNVASTAAFQPGPLMAVYYATKAYVLSFTEAIAEEVAGSGVKVSCLCPGPTQTAFATRASMTGSRIFKGSVMSADQVAREAFEGWNGGRVVIVPGFSNRTGTMVVRLSPRAWVRRTVKQLNGPA